MFCHQSEIGVNFALTEKPAVRSSKLFIMPTKNNSLGKSFVDRVKLVVAKIPKGKALTYKEVAKLAGNEKAYRAVATAMRKNYDLNIPCHRVIRSDGQVGEYNRGGQEEKLRLLLKEGWIHQK